MTEIKWDRLYAMLEKLTPLATDCGKLCGQKCCSLREEGLGMYLFPGEESMFCTELWCSIQSYQGGEEYFTGPVKHILNCRGKCPREKRPLACRLFPLAPYLSSQGKLEIIFDGDALFICPLVKLNKMESLDPAFRQAVYKVWEELLQSPSLREGVTAYSARADREAGDPWTRLLGR